ncbi:MAG: ferredoxin family protein [Phycisphaerales bacterium]|nr:ferredoxin family protein [Phycisphaerales bacterium]
MTHIIAEPCIGTKDTACVDVCPVDCIHPTKDEDTYEGFEMLYIDPETCIDCGLCVDECPVQAIFPEEDLPEEWQKYIQINADWYTENG